MRDVGFISNATNSAKQNSGTEMHLVRRRVASVSVTALNKRN